MIQTSATFAELIDTAPEVLHLILPNGTEVPQAAIQKAYWVGGTNAGDDITLGSTVSLQLQAELKRGELGGLDLTDARLTATLTIPGADDVIPRAVLQVDKPNSDDDVVTIVAYDAMIYAFSAEYALNDTVQGFDWEAGVDAEELLQAVCDICGITLATTGLPPVTLTNYTPAGHTYREVIAFLSCLWGRFARINGRGELVLDWYAAVDRPVLPTRYYQGELKKAVYTYTIGYVKCYNETLEETLMAGDASAAQGIYIKCPWMTPERLQAIFQEISGFAYRPISELRFLGDPRLEPGDVLQVTDRDGTTYTVPVMTLRQEYDGGLVSQVTAVGKSVSASEHDYEGPVTRAIERATKGIKASLVKYQDSIEAKVEGVEGGLSTVTQKVDSIKMEVQSSTGADGQTYASITLRVGDAMYTGQILLDGNVNVSGQLSADALYAALGNIADLTVDKFSTSRRIKKYLAGDTSDDNHIQAQDEELLFVSGVYAGDYEQATSPSGGPLYWESDPDADGVVLGADGYPYKDGVRIFTTTAETDWPVYVFAYDELVKARFAFEQWGDIYTPVLTMGAGNEQGYNKGFITKSADGLEILYKANTGAEIGMKCGNGGYTDIYGLRRTKHMDLSKLQTENVFTETIEGSSEVYKRHVRRDAAGRIVAIYDESGHEATMKWW